MTENQTEKYTIDDVYRWASDVITKEGYGPDFVYRHETEIRCAYVRNGEPSCLVGHMLHDNDVLSLGDLADYNYDGVYSLLDNYDASGRFTVAAIEFMHELQMEQDKGGTTWGTALQAAASWMEYTPPQN